jgi:hypothetical protein
MMLYVNYFFHENAAQIETERNNRFLCFILFPDMKTLFPDNIAIPRFRGLNFLRNVMYPSVLDCDCQE